MATYNGEKYIEEQLQSILNQTRPVDEVVICDDCSNDNTVSIVNRFKLSMIGTFRRKSGYKNENRKREDKQIQMLNSFPVLSIDCRFSGRIICGKSVFYP